MRSQFICTCSQPYLCSAALTYDFWQGEVPASLAEFTLSGDSDLDWYDGASTSILGMRGSRDILICVLRQCRLSTDSIYRFASPTMRTVQCQSARSILTPTVSCRCGLHMASADRMRRPGAAGLAHC